jgi:hypothetical protein
VYNLDTFSHFGIGTENTTDLREKERDEVTVCDHLANTDWPARCRGESQLNCLN